MLLAQVDNGVVTGTLRTDLLPEVVPNGRVFVDITDRPFRPAGQVYDPAMDTFSMPASISSATAKKTSKTAFLAALGPELIAAWFASTDPVLVFGREMFKADTSVNIESTIIAQVLAQGVALGLVKPEAAAAVQAAITALPPA